MKTAHALALLALAPLLAQAHQAQHEINDAEVAAQNGNDEFERAEVHGSVLRGKEAAVFVERPTATIATPASDEVLTFLGGESVHRGVALFTNRGFVIHGRLSDVAVVECVSAGRDDVASQDADDEQDDQCKAELRVEREGVPEGGHGSCLLLLFGAQTLQLAVACLRQQDQLLTKRVLWLSGRPLQEVADSCLTTVADRSDILLAKVALLDA